MAANVSRTKFWAKQGFLLQSGSAGGLVSQVLGGFLAVLRLITIRIIKNLNKQQLEIQYIWNKEKSYIFWIQRLSLLTYEVIDLLQVGQGVKRVQLLLLLLGIRCTSLLRRTYICSIFCFDFVFDKTDTSLEKIIASYCLLCNFFF